jgi:hypothetical protein
MPIDPSIPLQAKGVQLESPINQLGMMNEALKYGEMNRAIGEQNQLNEYLKSGADLSSAEGRRGLVNYGKTGLGYAKALNEQDLSAATLKKTTAEAGLKTFELDKNKIDKAITDISNHPDAQSAYADIQKRVQAGELPVDKANFIVQQLKSMPYEKFQMTQVKNLLNAKDKLTLEEQAKHNRTTEGISAGHLDVARKGLTQGTIPAGYRMTSAGQLEAMPGGPTTTSLAPKELQAREAKYPLATQAVNTFEAKTNQLEKDLITLRDHPGLGSITGIVAGRAPAVTKEGREAQALYDKIVARGGFKELQDMRAASPTGGALGNVSNQEGTQLRQSFAAIDRRQDASSVQKAIGDAISDLQGSKSRVREAYDMTYDYKGSKTPTTPPPAPGAGGNTVTIPGGKVLTFPTPEAATAYKQAAGL